MMPALEGALMNSDDLPADLVAFLQSDRPLEYDPADCEIGVCRLHRLEAVRRIEVQVSTEGEEWADDDPYHVEATTLPKRFDLTGECEYYDPVGILIYLPAFKRLGRGTMST